MKKLIYIFIFLLNFSFAHSQEEEDLSKNIKEDLNEILTNLSQNYIYLQEKGVDLDCVRQYYSKQIPNIKTEEQEVLFFEYLLNEFYDSHLILNTNTRSSFRLYSPIYATIQNAKPIITSVWQSQVENSDLNIIGAELIKINGNDIDEAIEQFPTHCNDKTSPEVREWIINKLLAGRYNQSRILTLKFANDKIFKFDLDKIKIKQNKELLTSKIENGIGIIRINNSLGRNNLISAFDHALDELMDTKGLIIDLRNTVDGGNSYVARGIMSRFISEPEPYQKHWTIEQFDGNPKVERTWVEYVNPRGVQYKKPVIILVGRWTGSMGEGLAIGFEGMGRAKIVGSEMERLAGEMNGFSFRNQSFGYRLSTAKLFHVNGTPREDYIPKNYVKQTTTNKDEVFEFSICLMNETTE